MKMDHVILSKGECVSSGLQLLLDRWRLQEEKLQVFEESLNDVNKLMMYQTIQENLEANNSETILQKTLSVLSNNDLSTSFIDGIFRLTSAQSITSSEDDFGHNLHKRSYEGEDINIPIVTNDESMEEFEKRIWGSVWKDEVFLNNDIVEGSYLHELEVASTSSKHNFQSENNEMVQLPIVVHSKNNLQSTKNAERNELSPRSLFQQDFQEPLVKALHLTVVSNDNFATSNEEVRPQIFGHTCSKDVGMSHNFESDYRFGTIDSVEDLGILVESKRLMCEKVESLEMAINLVSPQSSSSFLSNEESSTLNDLSKQRATFVESIMAFESERQMKREKEQLRNNEALKQEVVNMEKVLQVSISLIVK